MPLGRPHSVAVMVVVFFTLHHRNHAAMCCLADRMLELNGRVVDTEVAQQAFLYDAQDALAD